MLFTCARQLGQSEQQWIQPKFHYNVTPMCFNMVTKDQFGMPIAYMSKNGMLILIKRYLLYTAAHTSNTDSKPKVSWLVGWLVDWLVWFGLVWYGMVRAGSVWLGAGLGCIGLGWVELGCAGLVWFRFWLISWLLVSFEAEYLSLLYGSELH